MKREDKRQIIRLARSGSPERAWSLLMEVAGSADNDPDVMVLRGRLMKERAKRASGGDAAHLFAEAADLYEQAAHDGFLSYPLINAASLALLAGQALRCEKLARRVLDVVENDPDDAETPYWHGATRAEALLLLGEEVEARAALGKAVSRAPQAWEDHAATLGQMKLICAEKGISGSWLDRLRPPRSLHFAGIIGIDPADDALASRVADWLESENVGFAWGALAAGSDIVIAEALLVRGAHLHLVLPCRMERFRALSVEAAGGDWAQRFDAILERCEGLDVLEASTSPDPASVDLAEKLAAGLALHNARNLQSEAVALRIAGAGHDTSPDGPLRRVTIPARQLAGSARMSVPEQHLLKVALSIGGAVELFETPVAGWAAARTALAAGKTAALDLCYLASGDAPGVGLSEHLALLAALAEPGAAMASRAVAFALLLDVPGMHVENHGDLRTAGGLIPVCSLRQQVS